MCLTRLAALGALLLAGAVPASAQGMMVAPPPPLAAGTRAPAFTTRTLGGKAFSLRGLRGKVVLLDYWATWCGPCRMATPTLRALQKKYHRRGFSVVGMSMDEADTAGAGQAVRQGHADQLSRHRRPGRQRPRAGRVQCGRAALPVFD